MDVINLFINGWKWYFTVAVLSSVVLAIYGYSEYKKEKKFENCIEKIGVLLSEFIGSFLGWSCFYLLVFRLSIPNVVFGSFEIFLALGAFIGMIGYAYKIGENIDLLIKALRGQMAQTKIHRKAEKSPEDCQRSKK
jgi:hypothetical protein